MTISPLRGAATPDPPAPATLRLLPASSVRVEAPADDTDLVEICDLVARALGAPVTIEDVDLNVLAFSDHRDVDDASRTASILGRRVPEHAAALLRTEGVLARVHSRDGAVFVPPRDHGLGRVAHRICGDEQTFGAIWLATTVDLTPGQRRELREWSQVAARYFLRRRLDADDHGRDQSRLVARILAGEIDGTALEALGEAGGMSVIAVAAVRGGRHRESAALELHRLSASLRLHLSAVHPACVVAPVDGTVYAVVPTLGSAATARERAVSAAEKFAHSLGSGSGEGRELAIGVAGPVAVCADLPRARADADAVLRLLDGQTGVHVVHADDVQMRLLMRDLRDLVDERGLRLVGPVMRLADHDAATGSNLVSTLEAWLDAFGDVNVTADAVHVHPNTVRYRLRRASEVGGLDLHCPQARYEAMLQIRLLGAGASRALA